MIKVRRAIAEFAAATVADATPWSVIEGIMLGKVHHWTLAITAQIADELSGLIGWKEQEEVDEQCRKRADRDERLLDPDLLPEVKFPLHSPQL